MDLFDRQKLCTPHTFPIGFHNGQVVIEWRCCTFMPLIDYTVNRFGFAWLLWQTESIYRATFHVHLNHAHYTVWAATEQVMLFSLHRGWQCEFLFWLRSHPFPWAKIAALSLVFIIERGEDNHKITTLVCAPKFEPIDCVTWNTRRI